MFYVLIGEKYCGKTMSLTGDSRCDSPGSSAKYCTYSIVDIDTDTIIDMEILNKRKCIAFTKYGTYLVHQAPT